MFCRSYLFALLFVISMPCLFAQTSQRNFILGAGIHETFYAGMQYPIGDKYYFEAAAGLNPVTLRTRKYAMVYLAPGFSPAPYKNTRRVTPFLHLKNMAWYFEDSYNRFFVWGLNPELRLGWVIKRRLNIDASAGVVYNTVLKFTEKNTGFPAFPRKWDYSFSLQFNYRLLN